jgi:hypothetical protein
MADIVKAVRESSASSTELDGAVAHDAVGGAA